MAGEPAMACWYRSGRRLFGQRDNHLLSLAVEVHTVPSGRTVREAVRTAECFGDTDCCDRNRLAQRHLHFR